MITDILKQIHTEIESNRNESNIIGQSSYFKEPIKTFGWKATDVINLSKKYYHKEWTKDEVFEICEQLWKIGYMEHNSIAIKWCCSRLREFEECDFKIFEKWVKNYVTNWAMCDGFCNHSVGGLLMKYPELVKEIKKWTLSDNRWVRRASAVSFIIPAKQKYFEGDIFEIASILLEDKDDMVQKGYGWMLKSLSMADYNHKLKKHMSQKYQQKVFDFVMRNKFKMPRTALRYAIEKLPIEMKREAMII
ncbi:MAG: DNA alkylation repair protein [Rickettsiales bacterium]|jgi:3-methyladenine DNA glycosylase AlkD|nr:DNA alkylation repair protein [Rickettsiales bacterium]